MERLKMWLTHTQYSWSATLPTLLQGAYITHVTLDPRLPLFLSYMLKMIREPGDEAMFAVLVMKYAFDLPSVGVSVALSKHNLCKLHMCMYMISSLRVDKGEYTMVYK